MNKEVSNKKVIIYIVIFTIVILGLLMIAFSVFNSEQKKKVKTKTNTEVISITYAKEYNGLSMNNYIPLKDEQGKKLNRKEHYFDFNLKSKISNDISINYNLVLKKDSNCNLEDKQIKVYLEQENEGTYTKLLKPTLFKSLKSKNSIGVPKGSMVLINDKIVENVNDKYRLRVWIDEKAKVKKPVQCNISVSVYAKVEK